VSDLTHPLDVHPRLRTARDVARHYLGHLVYGANDGIITAFAVVAGVAGAALPRAVAGVLGVANLVAHGFSMGASNFLAIRSRGAVERAEGHRVSEPYAAKHGFATFVAFVTAGAVPLLSFVTGVTPERRFAAAAALAFSTLFTIGAARSLVAGGRWWRNGLEMLAVGAAASGVAFAVGRFLAGVAPGAVGVAALRCRPTWC
jgi:VIT1/CCC1 family predicted Fe2+/Mn2+ transporter